MVNKEWKERERMQQEEARNMGVSEKRELGRMQRKEGNHAFMNLRSSYKSRKNM